MLIYPTRERRVGPFWGFVEDDPSPPRLVFPALKRFLIDPFFPPFWNCPVIPSAYQLASRRLRRLLRPWASLS